MAEFKPRWKYDLNGVSENRRSNRIATPSDAAALLAGVDGNYDGGLSPSHGWKDQFELEYGYGNDTILNASGGLNAGGTMKGIFGVTFRVSDSTYAHGFIYRVLNNTEDKAVIRMKVRIGSSLTAYTDYSLGYTKGLLGAGEAYAGEQFHVEVFGRFVYIYRAGKEPLVLVIDEPTPGTYTMNVTLDTGPGDPPTLTVPTENSASALISVGGGRTANQDVTDIIPTMSVPTNDANARMLFFGFSNVQYVRTSLSGTDKTNPYLQVRNLPSSPQADAALNGPSDLGLWATPVQEDPTFGDAVWYVNDVPRTPVYPLTTSPHTEFEGLAYVRSSGSTKPQGLTYPSVWAYRLFDSRSGRLSPLSNRVEGNREIYGATAFEETIFTAPDGSRSSQMIPVSFPMIQVIYNKERYDTLLLYRSRRNTEGLSPDEIVLSLEKSLTLATYHIDTQPVDPDYGIAAYFPSLTDAELSQQPTWSGTGEYLSQMPFAGSALAYEGTMLFGKMSQLDSNTSGLGKVVWSSLLEISPELISPSDFYPLYKPDEEVERFTRLGPNVAAFTRLGSYLFRRETQYMKGMAMHKGFGIVNARAACEVGSDVYFITESGLNIISPSGKMQDLSSINYIIQNEWKNDLEYVELAFDQAASAVFIHNPVQEHTIALWLKTSRITEFFDTCFVHCFEADIPQDVFTEGSRLQPRAAFVQYVAADEGEHLRWRVFTYDYTKAKAYPSTLSPSGNFIYTTANNEIFTGDTEIDVAETIALKCEGCKLYILEGQFAGISLTVRYALGATTFVIEDCPVDLPIGTKLGLTPMYFEWIGPMLGAVTDEGLAYSSRDFNSTRHVDSMRVAFTDVVKSVNVSDSLARFQGGIYSGTDALPKDLRFPSDNRRDAVRSIENGLCKHAVTFSDPLDDDLDARTGVQGNVLFPSVRIFVPGVKYTLLSASVSGTLRGEDSMQMRE